MKGTGAGPVVASAHDRQCHLLEVPSTSCIFWLVIISTIPCTSLWHITMVPCILLPHIVKDVATKIIFAVFNYTEKKLYDSSCVMEVIHHVTCAVPSVTNKHKRENASGLQGESPAERPVPQGTHLLRTRVQMVWTRSRTLSKWH